MDGFAVHSNDTVGALLTSPKVISVLKQTGISGKEQIKAQYVDTGDPLPDWSNAVVPIENIEPLDCDGNMSQNIRNPDCIRIRESIAPWRNVRVMGEDIISTELVLPAGHILRPVDLGVVAASGHSTIVVAQRPKVAIIPTGSELIPVGHEVRSGNIIEFNTIISAAQVYDWGGEATRFQITPDKFNDIYSVVVEASKDHDLILLNAGSSAGSEDFSSDVISSLGDLFVHGVAVRPGHPVILGMIKTNIQDQHGNTCKQKLTPIIGVPGYPVSATLTCEIFVEPLLATWLGREAAKRDIIRAKLTRKITSPAGDDDYVRVTLGKVGSQMLASPLSRGAGVLTSLSRADGVTIVPRGSQGLPAGAEVNVELYRSKADINQTIFAIGSHDMTIDLMAQYLAKRNRKLSSTNVGSLGGIFALSRGETHFAGSHLLDHATGEYNVSYIRKYLSGIKVKLITLVERQQGLIVMKGNPLKIEALQDLTRSDIFFVNRQRGAGTRELLDYNLKMAELHSDMIRGYENEEYTHLAVAAAVSSGRADCGMGIAAAASALELDFIPLFMENYDLIIPVEHYESELLLPLVELLSNDKFRSEISALPGYNVESMGMIVAEL
jgi:putative molybdopterin biosynthesis protein